MPFGGGGNPCVICSKTAYPAETITFEKRIYHHECFKCNTCSKKMDGPAKAKAFEETLYCTHCFAKGGFAQKQRNVKWVKKEGTGSAVASKFGGGGTPCFLCTKNVFPAEAQSFDKKVYHSTCMKCTYEKTEGEECGKKLSASTASSFEDKLYCKQCFSAGGYAQKQRNVKWVKKEGGSSSAIASKFGGGGTKCTICDKTVYQAETVMFEKKPYHSTCFKCKHCEKQVTPSGAAQFEDAVYCTKCFKDLGLRQKQATVKKGAGGGGAVSAKFSKFGGGGNKCKKCDKTVYPAETVSFEKKYFHQACFVCEEESCSKKLTPATAEYHKGTDSIHCKACFQSKNYHRAANA